MGHALAGSAGTAISNLAIYPLDLIITRLQVQRSLRNTSSTPNEGEYEGVLDAFKQIYNKEGGITPFYTGVVQDTGKSIADAFLFFLFYNYLRSSRLQKHGTKTTTLPVLDELAVGALAGACSKFFTTPISNIVTRKQTSSMLSARSSLSSSSPSVSDIAQSIRSEKGIQGFWSGYSASLVLTLNPSITFFLYETFKRVLLPRAKRDDPGARLTFLMAAVSKSIASTITYPFSLAKARAQTSSSRPVDTETAEKLKDDVKNVQNKSQAETAGQSAKKLAQRSTVFDTIISIYRTDGPSALYEGIWGEIFKGFFSHGITMIIKESVHKLIIQTYFLILKALNKYPSPSELASKAGTGIQDARERVGETMKEGYDGASSKFESIVESGKEAMNAGIERLGVVGGNTKEATKNAEDIASKEAGHLLGNAQDMLGRKLEQAGKDLKTEK